MKEQLKNDLDRLEGQMSRVIQDLRELEDSWPDFFDESDAEDMYLRNMFCMIESRLSDTARKIQSVGANIIAQGKLRVNKNSRYEIEGTDCELTSGSAVEVLHDGSWIPCAVEHDGVDYYLIQLRDLRMDGLMGRVKDYPLSR